MHELALAQSLLRQAAQAAEAHRLRVVTRVGVAVGRYSGASPGPLAFAFEALRHGPVLGRANLEVRETDGDALQLEWLEGEP